MKDLNLKYSINPDGSATIYVIDKYNYSKQYKKFADCCTREVAEDIISYYENYTPKYLESKEFQING